MKKAQFLIYFLVLASFNIYNWHIFTVFLLTACLSLSGVAIHYAKENSKLKSQLAAEKLKVSAISDDLRRMTLDRDAFRSDAVKYAGGVEPDRHKYLNNLHQMENKKKQSEKTKI